MNISTLGKTILLNHRSIAKACFVIGAILEELPSLFSEAKPAAALQLAGRKTRKKK